MKNTQGDGDNEWHTSNSIQNHDDSQDAASSPLCVSKAITVLGGDFGWSASGEAYSQLRREAEMKPGVLAEAHCRIILMHNHARRG